MLLFISSQNRDLNPEIPAVCIQNVSGRSFRCVFTKKRENVKTKLKMSNNTQQVASTVWNLERLKLQVGRKLLD